MAIAQGWSVVTLTVMAATLRDRVLAVVQNALDPSLEINAVGMAQLVRAELASVGSRYDLAVAGSVELALREALDPRAQSNAVGVAQFVRKALEGL